LILQAFAQRYASEQSEANYDALSALEAVAAVYSGMGVGSLTAEDLPAVVRLEDESSLRAFILKSWSPTLANSS
jgi:hypothetical protein